MTSTKTRVNKVSTVVIPVADQEHAIEFYTQEARFRAAHRRARGEIPLGRSGARWCGDYDRRCPAAPGGSAGNRETGIGLQTDDIDAYHAELKADGVDVDAEVSRMGDPVPPMFWMRDPEGNTLMVVQ